MSQRTIVTKLRARTDIGGVATASAGPAGASRLAPPCGIDFVDRSSSRHAALQLKAAAPGAELPMAAAMRRPDDLTVQRSGLPAQLKAGIERLSGMPMDDVHVHYNSTQPAQLNALAYASGRDIHLAPGQERHLPHEAWHVVQQRAGRTGGAPASGLTVVQDEALEAEADRMGDVAAAHGGPLQAKAADPVTHAAAPSAARSPAGSAGVIQCKGDVVEDIVLEGFSKDEKKLKATLVNCIGKFRSAIARVMESDDEQAKSDLSSEMAEDGRDAFFYRRLWWKNKRGLMGDLERWSTSWSVARTGGLLADLGLALKNVEAFTKGKQFDEIMNQDYLQRGSNQVRGRSDETTSPWSEDLAQSGLKGNAGPSSTTTQLLHVVSSIGGFTTDEVESMMVALVKFWKGGTKRKFGGGFHTAVEVWAPYTGYLETTKQSDK